MTNPKKNAKIYKKYYGTEYIERGTQKSVTTQKNVPKTEYTAQKCVTNLISKSNSNRIDHK